MSRNVNVHDRPSVWRFVVLALPALLYLPGELGRRLATPLSDARYLSELLSLSVFLCPFAFAWMLIEWRGFHPRSPPARWAVIALLVWTGLGAALILPKYLFFLGIAY